MKKYLIALGAVAVFCLSSCGGREKGSQEQINDAKKDAAEMLQTVSDNQQEQQ